MTATGGRLMRRQRDGVGGSASKVHGFAVTGRPGRIKTTAVCVDAGALFTVVESLKAYKRQEIQRE